MCESVKSLSPLYQKQSAEPIVMPTSLDHNHEGKHHRDITVHLVNIKSRGSRLVSSRLHHADDGTVFHFPPNTSSDASFGSIVEFLYPETLSLAAHYIVLLGNW